MLLFARHDVTRASGFRSGRGTASCSVLTCTCYSQQQQKTSPGLERPPSMEEPESIGVEQRRLVQSAAFPASSSAPVPSSLLLQSASLEQSIRAPHGSEVPNVSQYAIQLQRYQQYLQLQQTKSFSHPGNMYEQSSTAGVYNRLNLGLILCAI